MKGKYCWILCVALASALSFTISAQTIEGELPQGYVAIKEADVIKFKRERAEFKKVLAEQENLRKAIEATEVKYEKLLLAFEEQSKFLERDYTQARTDAHQLEKLKKIQKENRETINNLKSSLRYCNERLGKYRARAGRKNKDVQRNGTDSAIDLNQGY